MFVTHICYKQSRMHMQQDVENSLLKFWVLLEHNHFCAEILEEIIMVTWEL